MQVPTRLVLPAILFLALLPRPVSAQENPGQPGAHANQAAPLEWQATDDLRFFGEVGFRLEYMANEFFAENDSIVSDDHRFRERVRLRFGAEYEASRWFNAGFRFSTGSPNYPASGWASFSDDFRRDPVDLDRIYINLRADWFRLRMGSEANPVHHPTEMVWDHDVQTAGLAQVMDAGRWRFALGQFMLQELRTSHGQDRPSFLIANGISFAPEAGGAWNMGVFQYLYTDPDTIAEDIVAGNLDADFKTNRPHPDDESRFFSDYHTLGATLSWQQREWRVVTEFAWNVGAEQDATLGPAYAEKEDIAVGGLLRYGELVEPGDWSLESGYFRIEADAVVAVFNSDDFQQTNVHAVPVWLRVRLPGDANLVWDTYFQKRINTALYGAGGYRHDESALKVRTRLTLAIGF